ncbi:hypothetical protein LXA43DRAFT_1089860 [Ganoderma leucocontextum]|nr:hypothetical protein LXA43DRAFT_1089860 [Ganoderma leucocontextum]
MPTLLPHPMGVEAAPQYPHQATPTPYPAEAVLNDEGLYAFPHDPDGEPATQSAPASQYNSPSDGTSTALGDVYTPSLEDAPTEIHALIRAQQSRVPCIVILCRGASLSALALPDSCGCAYLGFFFISEMGVSKSPCSWSENAEGPFVHGAVTWSFELDWTPGGDDPDALTTLSLLPWWMEDPFGPQSVQGADPAPSGDATISDNMDMSLQHPYTLLPLHFFAPPSQSGGGATGWRCMSCGRLNVQRNLCVQRCGSCSTSNGLAPLAVEDVRQFRGTDPVTFPWNRHAESVTVESSSSEAPEGLRRFTYKITDGAFVHHLFTRNHTAVQAQPTQLFHDLQAEVELEAEHVAKVARGAPSVSYGAQFGNASGVNVKSISGWPSDVPACICRARELMLRRARLDAASSALAINSLTISSWRSAGNKKGLVFAAAQSPVVVLCLGADVELTFPPPRQGGASRNLALKRKPSRPTRGTNDIEDDMDEDYLTDTAHSVEPTPRSTMKKQPKGPKGERTDATLMITLVHGDLLVMQGAAFEYSLKKTGMSILLFGSQ